VVPGVGVKSAHSNSQYSPVSLAQLVKPLAIFSLKARTG
jgi:hypothetical protein